LLKDPGEDQVQFESPVFPIEDLDVNQDPHVLTLALKKTKTYYPNADLEFLFRREGSVSKLPTAPVEKLMPSIAGKVYTQLDSSTLADLSIPYCCQATFVIPPFDIYKRNHKILYFLLLDFSESMNKDKFTLLTAVSENLIKKIPEESYFMVVKFSDSYEWLSEHPLKGTQENKDMMLGHIKVELSGRGGVDIAPSLKAALEMDFNFTEKSGAVNLSQYQRSIIIVSNGNIKEQKTLEGLILRSRSTMNTRVSAIGIGNGASDSFLRIASEKGLGLMEVIYSPKQVEDRVKVFLKRLQSQCIKSIRFEYDEKAIIQVLPMYSLELRHLKTGSFGVYVYFRKGIVLKKYTVMMYYYDEEDGSNYSLNLHFDLANAQVSKELHKVCINELLLNSDDVKFFGRERNFVEEFGKNWPTKISIENQVFCSESAFLVIAADTPKNFDPIKGDLSELGYEKKEGPKNKLVSVDIPINSDYIKKSSVKAPSQQSMNTNLSGTRFSVANLNTLSRKHAIESRISSLAARSQNSDGKRGGPSEITSTSDQSNKTIYDKMLNDEAFEPGHKVEADNLDMEWDNMLKSRTQSLTVEEYDSPGRLNLKAASGEILVGWSPGKKLQVPKDEDKIRLGSAGGEARGLDRSKEKKKSGFTTVGEFRPAPPPACAPVPANQPIDLPPQRNYRHNAQLNTNNSDYDKQESESRSDIRQYGHSDYQADDNFDSSGSHRNQIYTAEGSKPKDTQTAFYNNSNASPRSFGEAKEAAIRSTDQKLSSTKSKLTPEKKTEVPTSSSILSSKQSSEKLLQYLQKTQKSTGEWECTDELLNLLGLSKDRVLTYQHSSKFPLNAIVTAAVLVVCTDRKLSILSKMKLFAVSYLTSCNVKSLDAMRDIYNKIR